MRPLLSFASAVLTLVGVVFWACNRDHAALWFALMAVNMMLLRPTDTAKAA